MSGNLYDGDGGFLRIHGGDTGMNTQLAVITATGRAVPLSSATRVEWSVEGCGGLSKAKVWCEAAELEGVVPLERVTFVSPHPAGVELDQVLADAIDDANRQAARADLAEANVAALEAAVYDYLHGARVGADVDHQTLLALTRACENHERRVGA